MSAYLEHIVKLGPDLILAWAGYLIHSVVHSSGHAIKHLVKKVIR